jgi:molecular chaperone DnaK
MKTKLPFTLIKDEKLNSLKIELNFGEGKNNKEEFYPEQICALILKKIVNDSEFYILNKIGKDIKIKDVVITVPAYFNQKQREATINSAKILGLNVIAMINEPTAASLAYAINH